MDLRQAFEKAREDNYAFGAFNVSTLEQVRAVFNAVGNTGFSVMLELSPGEAEFFGIEILAGIRDSFILEKNPNSANPGLNLPSSGLFPSDSPTIFLNLDHAKDMNLIRRALEAGFDMIHFDGSELPFEENISRTRKVVELAKDYGALVEGEIDQAGGHSTAKEEEGKAVLTDPGKAAEFVSKTGVDILASFFGNLHGVYSKELELDFNHFSKLTNEVATFTSRSERGRGPTAVPQGGTRQESATSQEGEVFFSLHGGSGVRGGDLSKAAKQGIVKMNFNTELRQAWAGSLRESLAKDQEQIVPYKVLPPVVEAVQAVVEEKIELLKKK